MVKNSPDKTIQPGQRPQRLEHGLDRSGWRAGACAAPAALPQAERGTATADPPGRGCLAAVVRPAVVRRRRRSAVGVSVAVFAFRGGPAADASEPQQVGLAANERNTSRGSSTSRRVPRLIIPATLSQLRDRGAVGRWKPARCGSGSPSPRRRRSRRPPRPRLAAPVEADVLSRFTGPTSSRSGRPAGSRPPAPGTTGRARRSLCTRCCSDGPGVSVS